MTTSQQGAAVEVLIVEDEVLVRLSASDDLEDLGCTAVCAGSIAEARRVLQGRDGRVAAAIVDLGLPDGSGDGFVAELRGTWPALPVIVFSGAGPDAVRAELAADPLVGWLAKPYRLDALAAALAHAGVPIASA